MSRDVGVPTLARMSSHLVPGPGAHLYGSFSGPILAALLLLAFGMCPLFSTAGGAAVGCDGFSIPSAVGLATSVVLSARVALATITLVSCFCTRFVTLCCAAGFFDPLRGAGT